MPLDPEMSSSAHESGSGKRKRVHATNEGGGAVGGLWRAGPVRGLAAEVGGYSRFRPLLA